jgi:DNA-binding response OmpR family regulator
MPDHHCHGHDGQEIHGQAYAAGATDYVTKPFDVDDLTSRLGLAARSLE